MEEMDTKVQNEETLAIVLKKERPWQSGLPILIGSKPKATEEMNRTNR
jgi:hypothetical protein